MEIDLDSVLGGSKGTVTYERDGLGNQLAIGDRQEVASQPGANVVLTIDRYIQRVVEAELDKVIKQHQASGGTIVVVQPKTGEILAMASRPTADVTQPDLSDESKLALFRNRAITDTYEPGSVFKLVTMAAALDLGLVGPHTPWYDTGSYTSDGYTIRNWDFSRNGDQSVTQILSKSLNTGAAWLANEAGEERFYPYVDKFGFGKPSGIGLSGEVGGSVRTPESDPANWRSIDLATNSFGQGLSATPLQIAMAAAAIANDGLAMKPQIVKEIAYPGQRQAIAPEAGRPGHHGGDGAYPARDDGRCGRGDRTDVSRRGRLSSRREDRHCELDHGQRRLQAGHLYFVVCGCGAAGEPGASSTGEDR